jgi:transposase
VEAVLDEGGIDALRTMPARGRPAPLDDEQLQALGRVLAQKTHRARLWHRLWTLKRVGVLIERLYDVKFGQTQIWRILGGLGLSVQKPERRAIERDEDAVQTWSRSCGNSHEASRSVA